MRTYRLIILLTFVACKAAVPTSTATYKEDLSVHRPKSSTTGDSSAVGTPKSSEVTKESYAPLTGHIKAELDSIAKVAYLQNKEGRYVDGYIIQVYSGTSRDEANDARYKMDRFFPELDARTSYRQPSFRVKAGKFIDRLEANRIYKDVKEEFPRALLIPERFRLVYE